MRRVRAFKKGMSKKSPRRMTRRCFVGVCALVAVAAATPRLASATTEPEEAIRSFYATLEATMKNGRALGARGRYDKIAPALEQCFDLPYMTRVAVGPSWNRLSAEEKKQVIEAFSRYITATYADNFDSYAGEKLIVAGQQTNSYGTIVQSRIVKSNGEPVTINYLMHPNNGRWQVGDIYLTGTISQMATLRSQFSSVIQREGVTGLITMLNNKAQTLTASPA
jgi:phospholipid transport system substrate-binding protein